MSAAPRPPPPVKAVYDSYPPAARRQLLALRDLLFETAAALPATGPVAETLKWGEPSYLNKAGTAIRLAWSDKRPDVTGLFVNCQTTLIEDWRARYEGELEFVGNREIRFGIGAPPPIDPIRHCIAMALTYHRRKTRT